MRTLADRLQGLVGSGFRIERELPLGGMSRLYVARDLAVERDVVVKVLPPDLACTASTARFRREVELTAQLLHPNIVPVLSAGGADDVLYYVTPFVPGESLRELVAREGALPLAAVRRVLDDVLDALAYAHSRGVVHRDVKPGNILLAAGGRAMLADFGIASALSAADRTGSEIVPGTPLYMAPEHPSDVQADLWATCVVVHEMLTGVRPAPGVAASDVVRARARAVGMREARRAAPLAAVVARGLAVEPARRFADVEALRAAVTASAQRRLVTRRRLAGAAVATVLALAGFAVTRPSMEAARARERGRAAEARFELDSAIGAYREAVAYDSSDVQSRLAIARLRVWRSDPADTARLALSLQSLHPREADRQEAAALLALATGRFPEACATFASMLQRDSMDMRALMGFAECHRRDAAVVRDARSPSGYSFRTSYHAAARAYESILDRVPSASLVNRRLARVRIFETNKYRPGYYASGEGRELMLAYPALSGDTLAYVPWEHASVEVPSSRTAATEGNLVVLRDRFRDWTKAAPSSAAAHESLAQVLEMMGYISTPGVDDRSALGEIAIARRLGDTTSAVALLHVAARLHLKAEEWSAARRLTDSAFLLWKDSTVASAERRVGLAALMGRRRDVDSLLRTLAGTMRYKVRAHDGDTIPLKVAVLKERASLLAASALGDCGEARFAVQRIRRSLVTSGVPDSLRVEAELGLLERPLLLIPGCGPFILPPDGHPRMDPLVQLHMAFRSGGRERLGAKLRALDDRRRFDHPGDITMDYSLGEAMLLLAAGDTLTALERLDVALDGLPSQSQNVLADPLQAAALVRSMALCARLAASRGDWATAYRWSSGVATLWRSADTPLDATASDMRALSAIAEARRVAERR